MAKVSVIKALSNYFNVDTLDASKDGDAALIALGAKGKRSVSEWGAELRKFTPVEKQELAEMVAADTGWELTMVPTK